MVEQFPVAAQSIFWSETEGHNMQNDQHAISAYAASAYATLGSWEEKSGEGLQLVYISMANAPPWVVSSWVFNKAAFQMIGLSKD